MYEQPVILNSSVQAVDIPGKGRGIVCDRDLSPGELVIFQFTRSIVPFDIVLSNSFICSNCISYFDEQNECLVASQPTYVGNFKGASKCCATDAIFCSQRCFNEAKKHHDALVLHSWCCEKSTAYSSLTPELKLTLRLLLIKPTEIAHLQSQVEDHSTWNNHYKADYHKIDSLFPLYLKASASSSQIMSKSDFVQLGQNYFRQISINSFGVRPTLLDNYVYALGLFPFASYFNHSCSSNCHFYFQGNAIVIRTSTDIKSQEELTLSFMNGLESITRSDRLESLHKNMFFQCRCHRCTLDDYENVEYMAKDRLSHHQEFQQSYALAKRSDLQQSFDIMTHLYHQHSADFHPYDSKSLTFLDDLLLSLLLRLHSVIQTHDQEAIRSLCLIGQRASSQALDHVERLVRGSWIDHGNVKLARYYVMKYLFDIQLMTNPDKEKVVLYLSTMYGTCHQNMSQSKSLDLNTKDAQKFQETLCNWFIACCSYGLLPSTIRIALTSLIDASNELSPEQRK